MFKSYIVSIIGFLLGVGAIIYAGIYTNYFEPDNVKQTYVFNAKTIELKLIGKTSEEIAENYLPPVSVKKLKGQGNQIAHYEDIKIFTRHEKTVVESMDITFKKNVAESIKYGEAHKNRDASFANASPLAFWLMDKELFTKGKEVIESEQAEKWQIPLLLLLLVFLVNLPFLLTWPLATLMAKKMDDVAFFLIAPLWLLLYWIYLGIAAYAIGTAMVFLILGGIWLLIAMRAFYRAVDTPVYSGSTGGYSGSSYGSGSSSSSGSSYQPPKQPITETVEVRHFENLSALFTIAQMDKLPQDKIMQTISDIGLREKIDMDAFKYAVAHPSLEIPLGVTGSRKMQFVDDIAQVITCQTTISDKFLSVGLSFAEKYGLDTDQFSGRLRSVAYSKYQRKFPTDYDFIGDPGE